MTQQNKGVSKTFYTHKKKQSSLPWNKVKAPKKFAIWSFSSGKSSSSISGSSRTKKRRKRYKKYTEEKESEDKNRQKNADFLPFLALFQGKELCFVLCGKKFLIRPLPFGLNSFMTQQNKGVSKTFYHIRKNRVPYLEIKWKPPKHLQFDRLVVVKVVVV